MCLIFDRVIKWSETGAFNNPRWGLIKQHVWAINRAVNRAATINRTMNRAINGAVNRAVDI